MSKKSLNLLAIDCGNSAIRVTLGQFDGDRVQTRLIHQVEQREVYFNGLFYWDILFLYQQMKNGLSKAYAECGGIDSAAISTWGIDFGLLNGEGYFLSNPLSYRNTLGKEALEKLPEADRRFNFFNSGIQCDKINTLYQILGFREKFPRTFEGAGRLLLIPDLLNYLFTGEAYTESTILSTSQLYDVQKGTYSEDILAAFNIDGGLFPAIKKHGEVRGFLRAEIAEELGINVFPFITIPSHDTAAAVGSICPGEDDREPLFISSGTWCLIGTELQEPLVNEAVYQSDFTNEGGILGTTTFLKNSAGLYIARRLYDECFPHNEIPWEEVAERTSAVESPKILFDPNDDVFFNPPSMRKAIINKTGIKAPDNFVLFRLVYDSLAHSYKGAIEEIEHIRGGGYGAVYIVGGGSRNKLLNRITAAVTGKTVIAGPDEATSFGNLGAQLLYRKRAESLADIRGVIQKSIRITVYGD
ncbi:MAG: carbohydrate kinase [Spirochaetaceae bacterium]|nr:carbohydrate kinase [Spirochaetaceae bacterium]